MSGQVSLVKGVKETLLAATMFGFYWPMNEYIAERADWLVITLLIKVVAIVAVYLLNKFRKQSLVIKDRNKNTVKIIVVVGLLEALAVMSVSYGLAYDDSIIVAPIAFALTIVTVTLTFIFLKEKLKPIQWAGVFTTIFGIVLSAL